ncbi:MAG TPA: glucans biosynthesis glucosyltransferase MdoH [Sphingomonas sp.]|nr:glucans biosynthesis glucosyltransferase MdoH [Sphingomonas sp.]
MNLASHQGWQRAPALSADLPPEAPLAMPEQDFDRPPRPIQKLAPSAHIRRRGFLIVGSAVIGFGASFGIANLLAGDGYDAVDQLLALISLALFAWIGFGFLNALAGLFVAIANRRTIERVEAAPSQPVAVLIPVYNEDIAAVGARIARMTADLSRIETAPLFHFFILSDSSPSAEAGERAACRLLRRPGGSPIHYRRRAHNEGRKPGNIAEWVRRFGAAYESMLILDADSRMSGEAMMRLASAMEADPTLGLIQTNPQLTAGRTLFARWQQFAVALYGPISSAGLQWWSGDEATFWGHNAIVRVKAFAESCGLPTLPGAEPLGGHIMSHDMVEAALLRRRGWRTRMMLMPTGSYEECPPTLIDHGIRDRRWCQGNLQHLRLLDATGLHWVSRLQLLMGASAYLTSPLWLFLLVVGVFQSFRTGGPIAAAGTPGWLIGATVILLFGTKLLALVWAAFDREQAQMLGGWRAILLGVAVDIPLSVLMAPIMMASQCLAIVEILSGRPSGWKPQRRETEGVPLLAAFEHYRWHVLIGLPFWLVTMADLGAGIWQLPVVLGLFGAPLLAAWTSRVDWADRAARYGLFVADPGEIAAVRPREPAPPMETPVPAPALAAA